MEGEALGEREGEREALGEREGVEEGVVEVERLGERLCVRLREPEALRVAVALRDLLGVGEPEKVGEAEALEVGTVGFFT